MPMIDVYATSETFADLINPGALPRRHLNEDRTGPGHPDVPTEHRGIRPRPPHVAPSNVQGDSNYVRVQVLTNAGALDRAKQLAVVRQFTDSLGRAAGDASLSGRTWVLLTEAVDGGWGLAGHANTNAELLETERTNRRAGGLKPPEEENEI
jgi:phenylpyruvate tautomerase PptA (4-oxalocrotonate tautomerase family)